MDGDGTTGIGMGEKMAGVARHAQLAKKTERRLQLANEFASASISLNVDVTAKIVRINDRPEPIKLIDHGVDTVGKLGELDVADGSWRRRSFVCVGKRAAQVLGVVMARGAVHGDRIISVHGHAAVIHHLVPQLGGTAGVRGDTTAMLGRCR